MNFSVFVLALAAIFCYADANPAPATDAYFARIDSALQYLKDAAAKFNIASPSDLVEKFNQLKPQVEEQMNVIRENIASVVSKLEAQGAQGIEAAKEFLKIDSEKIKQQLEQAKEQYLDPAHKKVRQMISPDHDAETILESLKHAVQHLTENPTEFAKEHLKVDVSKIEAEVEAMKQKLADVNENIKKAISPDQESGSILDSLKHAAQHFYENPTGFAKAHLTLDMSNLETKLNEIKEALAPLNDKLKEVISPDEEHASVGDAFAHAGKHLTQNPSTFVNEHLKPVYEMASSQFKQYLQSMIARLETMVAQLKAASA